MPADNELHPAVQPFDCGARHVQTLVRAHPPEARHDRTSPESRRNLPVRVRRASVGGDRPRRDRRVAITTTHPRGWYTSRTSSAADWLWQIARIACSSEQPIPVPIPAIRPFVRFEIVDRPDALHAAAARRPKEPVQLQEMIDRTRRTLNQTRSTESSPPEAFGPVQVHPIDAATSSPEPLQADLEIVGNRDPAFRQGAVAQREVRVPQPGDTGRGKPKCRRVGYPAQQRGRT